MSEALRFPPLSMLVYLLVLHLFKFCLGRTHKNLFKNSNKNSSQVRFKERQLVEMQGGKRKWDVMS